MCLAIPGKIISINESGGIKMCKVDFGGVVQEACIETVPEAKVGDFIIVHAGFALNTLSEEEANETLEIFRQLEMFDAEIRMNDKQLE
ncbi:MAG: HypC/HybG/HupF family hydrogenase formation chaperone [Anaerolineaceae bacterium]|nr:HypC/HybG/HupF family hydrogenase formation chaperone [Anaerolineaceae bacterium]